MPFGHRSAATISIGMSSGRITTRGSISSCSNSSRTGTSVRRSAAPGGQEHAQILRIHLSIAIEVRRTVGTRADPPRREQQADVAPVDLTVPIEVGEAGGVLRRARRIGRVGADHDLIEGAMTSVAVTAILASVIALACAFWMWLDKD